MEKPPAIFAAVIIALVAAFALSSCSPKFTTKELPKPEKVPEGTVYLLHRYARTSETGVIAFEAGTAGRIVSQRPGFVTLAINPIKFELPESEVTSDPLVRDTVMSDAAASSSTRTQAIEAKSTAVPDQPQPRALVTVQALNETKVKRLSAELQSEQHELAALNDISKIAPVGESGPDGTQARHDRMVTLKGQITSLQAEIATLQTEANN